MENDNAQDSNELKYRKDYLVLVSANKIHVFYERQDFKS